MHGEMQRDKWTQSGVRCLALVEMPKDMCAKGTTYPIFSFSTLYMAVDVHQALRAQAGALKMQELNGFATF